MASSSASTVVAVGAGLLAALVAIAIRVLAKHVVVTARERKGNRPALGAGRLSLSARIRRVVGIGIVVVLAAARRVVVLGRDRDWLR